MPAPRCLLFIARLEAERKRKLGVIATADQLELVVLEDTGAALTWLEQHEPRAVVFEPSIPKVEKACQKLRSKKQLAAVPLIALASELDDPYVAKLYAMGADDVVPSSAWAGLIARLRLAPSNESLVPPPARGRAVVADPDAGRRDVIGRVLSNAGYEVRFALDARALEYYSEKKELGLIVASAELESVVKLAEASRKRRGAPSWVITAPRRELSELAEAVAHLEQVAVVGAFAPPENVLFTANQLAEQGRNSGRKSDRVLHGTLVWFRAAGADDDEIGFSYNVSQDGLYVRTLAPVEADELWLELRPPRSKARVRLEGRVVWRQRFGATATASGPAGFGVTLVGGMGNGLAAWHEGYASLAERAGPGGLMRASRPELESLTEPVPSAPAIELTGAATRRQAPAPAAARVKSRPPPKPTLAKTAPRPSPPLAAPDESFDVAPVSLAPPLSTPPPAPAAEAASPVAPPVTEPAPAALPPVTEPAPAVPPPLPVSQASGPPRVPRPAPAQRRSHAALAVAALVVVGAAVGGALALRSAARTAAPPASALDEALAAPPVSAADTAPSAPLASAPEAAPP
ncbi:MAG: hypothetical protein OZ921_10620, partial [Sorangiineae bacterium]|nr:hypothetical protein [Sorangiineae bacterium]